jgi:hypothetical protein
MFLKKIAINRTVIGRSRPHGKLSVGLSGAAVNAHQSLAELPVPSLYGQ